MKRVVLFLYFSAALSGNHLFGQNFRPVNMVSFQNPMTPLLILEHFARTSPDAIPFWGTEGNNYTVRYIDPNTAMGHKIVFNRLGVVLHSENELALSECPAGLVEYCYKNHANEAVRIWTYEENSGIQKYFIRVQSKIVWFDKEGKFLRKKIWN